MSQPFDFDKALKALQPGQALTGKEGILTPLIKQLAEVTLSAELESHLAQDVEANRKNGSGKKTIKAPTGTFELATPRDRNSTFEPQLVKKYQTTLSDETERKIIRLFALGMSYQDICREIGEMESAVSGAWRRKWENLPAYFRYPANIRKIIYTTNTIESVHRQFRKLTKTKGAFPNENSLSKLLYLGLMNAEKWTMPIQSWNLTLSQLAIYFEERLNTG
ncbi:transposase [Escherichia marmotae]|uniref:transposase n=1 Tax=Escherichia marmotae TaxID=1499973 RepID=UPI002F2E18AD